MAKETDTPRFWWICTQNYYFLAEGDGLALGAGLATGAAVMLILPSAAMVKKPSAEVVLLLALKRKPETPTASEASTVPMTEPEVRFSA